MAVKRLYLDTNHLIALYESGDAAIRVLRRILQSEELALVLSPIHGTDLREGNYAHQVQLAESIDRLPILVLPDPAQLQFVEAFLAFQRLDGHGYDFDPVKRTYGECATYLASLCPWSDDMQGYAAQAKGVTNFAQLFHVTPQWTMAGKTIPDRNMGQWFQQEVTAMRQSYNTASKKTITDQELFKLYVIVSCKDEFSPHVDLDRINEIDPMSCPTILTIKRFFVTRFYRDKNICRSDFADLFHSAAVPHVDYYVCEKACAGSLRHIRIVEPVASEMRKVFGSVEEFLQALEAG